METDTLDLIDQIHENARFQKHTLAALIRESEDGSFRNALAEQFASCRDMLRETREHLKTENAEAAKRKKPTSGIGDISARIALQVNLRIDNTPSHMAEMVMQASLSNIVEIAAGMRIFAGAEEAATALARKFIEQERENIGRMIDYL